MKSESCTGCGFRREKVFGILHETELFHISVTWQKSLSRSSKWYLVIDIENYQRQKFMVDEIEEGKHACELGYNGRFRGSVEYGHQANIFPHDIFWPIFQRPFNR